MMATGSSSTTMPVELLAECAARRIPLGIVSNAHSGRAHRAILADLGLDRFFGVQVYSDEVGIRKPHPGMIRLAAEGLGVAPQQCWYVGDTFDRDVVAGRRAGAGAVVITRDRRTDTPPFRIAEAPDLVLETPEGLIAPLRAALDSAVAEHAGSGDGTGWPERPTGPADESGRREGGRWGRSGRRGPTPLAAPPLPGLRSRQRRPSAAVEPRRTRADGPAEIVATLRGVRHGYRSVAGGLSTVLDDLDLDLHAGERIALVGTNGAGKTTLMKLLTGLIVPRAGTVTVDGIDTRTRSAATMADHVSYLYQHPQQMFLKDTVREDIALFPRGRKVPDAEAIVERIIEDVGLSALADRDGRSLSGGQQRRATLGIGLAMRPSLLLLDEPTSSLDIRSRDDVTAMLAALAETVRCAVVATHDMELVATWASRVLVLDQGRVLADVTPRELFSRPELTARTRLVPPQAARIALELGLDPLPLTAAELRAWLPKEVR